MSSFRYQDAAAFLLNLARLAINFFPSLVLFLFAVFCLLRVEIVCEHDKNLIFFRLSLSLTLFSLLN